MKRTILLFLLCLAPGLAYGQGIITTVAGGRVFVFPRNAVAAADAPLGQVSSVAVDPAGNVYATDSSNNLVVKVTPDGILTIVAGNGTSGFSPDGTAATAAALSLSSLNESTGVSVDSAGNVFFLDNERVRKVGMDGTLTTVAGTGTAGYCGDGGPATQACINRAQGLGLDANGNIYIADSGNNRVRRFTLGGLITTVAGDGRCCFLGDGVPATSTPLNNPAGVVVDAAGNIFIADSYNDRVRKVSTEGIITTVAGGVRRGYSGDGGPATLAALNWPAAVALDTAGNLYIADRFNQRIRRVAADGAIRTIAGNGSPNFTGDGGPAAAATLSAPMGVAVDAAGNLYVADSGNSRIRKLNAGGIISTLAGNGQYKFAGDAREATDAVLYVPTSVIVDPAGNFYISDSGNNRVRKAGTDGIITTIAGRGMGFAGDGGPATQALLRNPMGLALDLAGNLYIADSGNRRVRKVDPAGIITTVAGSDSTDYSNNGDGGPATAAVLNYPAGVAMDAGGNLYITDSLAGRIRKVSPSGAISTFLPNSFFNFPKGIAIDSAGNIYVSVPALGMARRDGGVTRISPDGAITSVVSGLLRPGDVALDRAGNVYVADAFDHIVLKSSPAGKVTVAGTGMPGYSGDGGPATAAALNNPLGVALDAAGNLYIGDSGNDRIRKVFFDPASGLPQPSLQTTLQPGFYIAEVRTGQGARAGYWGMEVLLANGPLAGNLYLGGAIQQRSQPPGFGAFYLPQPQAVHIRVDAQMIPGGDASKFSLGVRLLDSGRRQIGSEQTGTASVEFSQALSAGFYIIEVRGGADAPRATFQMGLGADLLDRGLDAGGFVSEGLVGFTAFYVPAAQQVTVRLLGQPSYGADGAGPMRLTLLDGNRNIIGSVP